MAKKERELSPAEKELSARRAKLDAAKEADSKNSTDKTKAAVAAAKSAVDEQNGIVNRERFTRVGGNRMTKALAAIKNLSGVAAPRSYSYSEADVVKAETALTSAVASTIAKMRKALDKSAPAAKAGEEFSF